MSSSTERHADNSGNHADLIDLSIFAITQSNCSINFLLTKQYEVPFITRVKRQKRWRDRKENGKCTNAKNRRRRLGQCQPHFTLYFGSSRGSSFFPAKSRSLDKGSVFVAAIT